ncbi:alpha/beta hydrolase [Avibacterium sp. 21-599]|uniref:alpha/beta hydrolase n=1 Tax=Avibacterium sp. 21-599 TaxID=2911528 RepID=UPI002245F8C2|nr:alpha/beta fold hydrolase [Avibacterium sp. 21-599]MCW9717529.1 alpha/beta hydrolase [Avibacterium sp. 21-599]
MRSRRMPLIPRAKPLIIAPDAAQSCIIFLHGLTTSGQHFRSLAEYLQQKLPHTTFILPHAPIRPVTWAGGNTSGWYDLRGDNFLHNEDKDGLQEAAAYVHRLIAEVQQQGIASQNIVLGGFSQGGAVSLLAGLTTAQPLGGLFSLSGYLPLAESRKDYETAANLHTPIFMAQGQYDELITETQIQPAVNALAERQNFSYRSYPIGHEISQMEIDDLATWLQKLL